MCDIKNTFYFKTIIDSHALIRNNTEIPCALSSVAPKDNILKIIMNPINSIWPLKKNAFISLCCVLVAAHGIFSCSRRIVLCSMWDLVPWLGFEPGPAALRLQSPNPWITREVFLITLKTWPKEWWVEEERREKRQACWMWSQSTWGTSNELQEHWHL